MPMSRGFLGLLTSPTIAGSGSLAGAPKDDFKHGGLFKSDVAGRTDRLPHSVPADSFVIPAAEVASLGQGNTDAGAKILDGVFGKPTPHAKGNKADVMVAGGEYLVGRDKISEIGRRLRKAGKSKAKTDLKAGHDFMHDFVLNVRKKELKRLKTAPKPKS